MICCMNYIQLLYERLGNAGQNICSCEKLNEWNMISKSIMVEVKHSFKQDYSIVLFCAMQRLGKTEQLVLSNSPGQVS